MHEICLSIMITSIKHPIIFLMLVFADVAENAFCIWSLYHLLRVRDDNVVVPFESSDVDDDNDKTQDNYNNIVHDDLPVEPPASRTSSVYKLMKRKNKMTMKERRGTALFIAATLLQREMTEVVVPIQALGVISILYVADVPSNSVTSSWQGVADYHQTLMYTGIDFAVELCVFVGTIFVLQNILPNTNPWMIIRGLIRMHFFSMFLAMCAAWLGVLIFQSTFGGMDTTFRFEWVKCDSGTSSNNATWLGGFDWNC